MVWFKVLLTSLALAISLIGGTMGASHAHAAYVISRNGGLPYTSDGSPVDTPFSNPVVSNTAYQDVTWASPYR